MINKLGYTSKIIIKEVAIITLCAFLGVFLALGIGLTTNFVDFKSSVPYTFYWLISYIASIKIRNDLK